MFVIFGLTFMKFRKLISLYLEKKNLDRHKTYVFSLHKFLTKIGLKFSMQLTTKS